MIKPHGSPHATDRAIHISVSYLIESGWSALAVSSVMFNAAGTELRGHCMQLRAYCSSLSQETKAERTAVLLSQLADWAVGSRKLHTVIRLPLDGLEEQVRPSNLCWTI